jgi:hypothetical protein
MPSKKSNLLSSLSFIHHKNGEFYHMSRFLILSLIIFTSANIYSQDSLYLITTLVGESTENHLEYAKGLGDINGDGYDDIIISFSSYCNIYFGGEPFDWQPDVRFNSGGFLTPGDVNNDGYADVLISYSISDDDWPINYIMKLYFGGATVDTVADFEFTSPYYRPWCSRFVNAIGDVNGDGYNDFVISEYYNWSNGVGHVYLFWGGETIESEPALTFTLPPSGYGEFGNAVCGIGDVNQDGFDDILISTLAVAEVYLYYGGSEMDSTSDIIYNVNNDFDFGNLVINAGNLNSDNFNDFIITSGFYTYIFFGLDSSLAIFSHSSIFGIGGYICATAGGDINNDGFDDFLIGNTNYKNSVDTMVGAAFGYYGNAVLDTIYDFKMEGETKWGEFSKSMSIAGDINSDGFDDVIIIAPSYPDYENELGKLYLYSYQQFPVIIDKKEQNPDYIPDHYYLQQNYPNPFNATTKIEYYLAEKSSVTIEIFNCIGKRIISFNLGTKEIGKHSIIWNGKDNDNKNVASGIYFVRLIAQAVNNISYSDLKKVV